MIYVNGAMYFPKNKLVYNVKNGQVQSVVMQATVTQYTGLVNPTSLLPELPKHQNGTTNSYEIQAAFYI